MKTEDAGITWEVKYYGDFWIWGPDDDHPIGYQWGFMDLEFDYENTNIVYATGHIILKSFDGGNTWDEPYNDITEELTDFTQVGITKISTHPNHPGKAWIIYQEEPLVSTTSGNYIVLYDKTIGVLHKDNAGGFSKYKGHIQVSPNDINTVYYSGLTMHEYIKDGQWPVGESHPISTSSYYGHSDWIHVDVRDIQVVTDEYNEDKLYVANDGSINWGTFIGNNGWKWEWTFIGDDPVGAEMDGLNVTEFHAFGISKTESDKIVGGAQDLNGFMYDNNAWYQVAAGDGGDAIIDPDNSNIIYQVIPCCGGATIIRTINNYMTTTNIKNFGESIFMDCPLYFKPGDPNTIYSGFKTLFRIDNARTTADIVDLNLPNSYISGNDTYYHIITDIALYENDPDIMYVSTRNYVPTWQSNPVYEKSLFKSTDGGQTWIDISENINNGLYGGFIRDVEINPDNQNEIWLSFGLATSNDDPDLTKKVYYTTDGGSTWQNYSQGFPEGVPVSDLEYDNIDNTLYLASDVGIFYRTDGSAEWLPYNFNLPYCRVYEVEINTITNKIYAGTYGRGIWKSELAQQCPPANPVPLNVEEDLIISDDQRLHQDIVVKSGYELTITGQVFMGSYNKIIVERGAKLIVDGGTISNSCNEDTWFGIEVWGNTLQCQNPYYGYQGIVELKNGTRIVNARVGISTIKGAGGVPDLNYAGGIIRINDAKFINNGKSVKMYPYENFDPNNQSIILNNLSYFVNCEVIKNGENNYDYFMEFERIRGIKFDECDFITNLSFQEGSSSGNSMIHLDNCNNFVFQGCNFTNTKGAMGYLPTWPDHGIAINSFYSSFTVKELCYENPLPPCSEYKSSVFQGLFYGVKVYNDNFEEGIVNISKTDFISCYKGIYLSGISYPEITENHFRLPFTLETPDITSYGIYLDQCNGFKVEENIFEPFILNYQNRIGIIVNNSGSDYNELYKNYFEKLLVGILAQNNNRSEDPFEGLKLKCNEFDNSISQFDIAVTSDVPTDPTGIAKYQGFTLDPSGNLFSKNFAGIYGDYNNEEAKILYYHHDPTSEPKVYPEDYSLKTISRENTGQEYDPEYTCPSQLDPGGGGTEDLRSEMETSKTNEENITVILDNYVDGGNTENMASEVVMSTPPEAWDVYTGLMTESPYLSDTVMKETVQKENVLTDAMVRDVLVANPQSAKSDEVMEAVEQRSDPLPGYMVDQIEQGMQTVSAKEQLEAEKSYWGHNYHMARNNLLRHFISDSLFYLNYDSIVDVLQNQPDINSKYELALFFLSQGDMANMQITLNSVANPGAKHQEYHTYTGILADLTSTNTGFNQMTSQHLSDLENLADYGISEVAVFARNILIETGYFDYEEPVILPVVGLKSAEIIKDVESDESADFRLYPNPAKDYFTVEYDAPLTAGIVYIEISDMTGKKVQVQTLAPGRDKKMISTKNLSFGVYVVNFIIDGNITESEKLTIK